MDSVTAGLVGTVVGAALGPIGTYVNGALAPQAAISREKKKAIQAKRKEGYEAISMEIESLKERMIGPSSFLAPDVEAARSSRRGLSLWASSDVLLRYETYRFALTSNFFFRLRRETAELNDKLVTLLLGMSDDFLRDYREVDRGLRYELGGDLDVQSRNFIVIESSRDVMRCMRKELGSF